MQSHDAVEKELESHQTELRGSQTCCGSMWSHSWNSVLADPSSWAARQAQLKVCWVSIRWLLDRPSFFCAFKQQMSGVCYFALWPLLPFKPPSPPPPRWGLLSYSELFLLPQPRLFAGLRGILWDRGSPPGNVDGRRPESLTPKHHI